MNSFPEKLAEATRKFHDLEAEVGISSQNQDQLNLDVEAGLGRDGTNTALINRNKSHVQKSKGRRKLKELKFAVSEFYLTLIMIQNFQVF